MLFTCLLASFLSFVASDDFDEIIHRNTPAMEYAKQRLFEMVLYAKKGIKTNDRVMFVTCNGTDYSRNFTFLKNYDYHLAPWLGHYNLITIIDADIDKIYTYKSEWHESYTSKLKMRVRGEDLFLSLQFWQFQTPSKLDDEKWQLARVEDLTCGLPKRHYLLEAIEMDQYFYFTDGEWEKKQLNWMFTGPSWFRFCDGSVERYFFHQNDTWSHDPLILHDEVKFTRETERSYKIYGNWKWCIERISYIRMYMNVNGRRMQLEYDDDWKMFTKGREYPCNGEKVENWT